MSNPDDAIETFENIIEGCGCCSPPWQEKVAARTELYRSIELLLLNYSEWLDADQGLLWATDERTHEVLVSDFLAGRE